MVSFFFYIPITYFKRTKTFYLPLYTSPSPLIGRLSPTSSILYTLLIVIGSMGYTVLNTKTHVLKMRKMTFAFVVIQRPLASFYVRLDFPSRLRLCICLLCMNLSINGPSISFLNELFSMQSLAWRSCYTEDLKIVDYQTVFECPFLKRKDIFNIIFFLFRLIMILLMIKIIVHSQQFS